MPKKQGIEEGPPIWVESLLTREEWKEYHRRYKTNWAEPVPMFECEFKWRYRMGLSLLPEEIALINSQIDKALKEANLI